ncbi:S-layer homology domain-containing protein [Anoxybacterium hadale]|uniref:S-layer homology domain-containing protein n=1 Tax=Anoxybacterium hadale TaxID=3408580 RepID=UPI003B002D9A
MKRNYLSLLLMVCMVFTALPSGVFAFDSGSVEAESAGTENEFPVIEALDAAMEQTAAPLTAAEYATNANSGTDYLISDDTTLIIMTAVGAAYWSASGGTYLDYNVKLDDDIDISEFQWTPIGSVDENGDQVPFTGSFDGGGHRLSGVNFAGNRQFSGLFDTVKNAVIKNITASGSIRITDGASDWVKSKAGIAAGFICNVTDSTIINCHSEMNVTVDIAESSAGSAAGFIAAGIAAFAGDNVIIDSCSNNGEISVRGTDLVLVGGIIADMELLTGSSSIKNCSNTGALTAEIPDSNGSFSIIMLGGIAGTKISSESDEHSNATVENCYNTGNLDAGLASIAFTGGIAGYQLGGSLDTISNCYNVGTVTSTANLVNSSAGINGTSFYESGTYSSYWKTGTADICVNDGLAFNCGTFDTEGFLDAATDKNAGSQRVEHGLRYGRNLLTALNGWVQAQPAPADYKSWVVKPGVNNGYPIFNTVENPGTVRKAALDLSIQTSDEDKLSTEGWAWYFAGNETLHYAEKTLVLSGLTLHATESIALTVPDGTTIVLADDTINTIVGGNATSDSGPASAYGVYCPGALTILGDGTLNVFSGKATCTMEEFNGYEGKSAGIYSTGNLILTGDAAINATGGEATSLYENGHSTGIMSGAVMTIQSGTIIGIGGNTAYEREGANAVSNGIFASSVKINGGTVTAYGGSDAGESCGIFTSSVEIVGGNVIAAGGSGSVDVSEGIFSFMPIKITGGVVKATGGTAKGDGTFGISMGLFSFLGIEISGGTIIATGGEASKDSYGIYTPNTVSITGGTVESTSGDTGTGSYGIYSGSENEGGAITLTITGGRVTAKNGEAPDKAAIIAFNSSSEPNSTFTLTIGSAAKPASIENATDGTNVITASRGRITSGKLLMFGGDAVVVSWKTSGGNGGGGGKGSNTPPVIKNPEVAVSNVPVVSDGHLFSDIDAHWAKEDILFVVSRGLFAGTGSDKFSPDLPITRGMLVTALGRLAQADVGNYKESSFVDVPASAYYTGYVEWAHQSGIVNGMGGGKYAPDAVITRQQMAVMIDRYAAMTGFQLPASHKENKFADGDKIRSWAKDAVERAQLAGILNGKTGNLVDPDGNATRAEVSSVLRRYIELSNANDKTNQ